jgi:hypothetical protein
MRLDTLECRMLHPRQDEPVHGQVEQGAEDHVNAARAAAALEKVNK